MEQLTAAAESARDDDGNAIRGKLPSLFKTWAPVAWGDLLAQLPEEGQGGEVCELAEDEFRRRIGAALLTFVSLGNTYVGQDGVPQTIVERRPLLVWAQMFAKPGGWQSVRGYRLWSRQEGEPPDRRCRVALRAELFGQLPGHSDLAQMSQRRLTELCELYGIGVRAGCPVAMPGPWR